MADVVMWSGRPIYVYSWLKSVYCGGSGNLIGKNRQLLPDSDLEFRASLRDTINASSPVLTC